MVDLGSVQHISEIQLFNRTDCCESRLSQYKISGKPRQHRWVGRLVVGPGRYLGQFHDADGAKLPEYIQWMSGHVRYSFRPSRLPEPGRGADLSDKSELNYATGRWYCPTFR